LVRFLEKNKGKKATTCEVLEYSNSAEVGGHVIIAGETAKGYILLIFYDLPAIDIPGHFGKVDLEMDGLNYVRIFHGLEIKQVIPDL
jgi:hypothetical protein